MPFLHLGKTFWKNYELLLVKPAYEQGIWKLKIIKATIFHLLATSINTPQLTAVILNQLLV